MSASLKRCACFQMRPPTLSAAAPLSTTGERTASTTTHSISLFCARRESLGCAASPALITACRISMSRVVGNLLDEPRGRPFEDTVYYLK